MKKFALIKTAIAAALVGGLLAAHGASAAPNANPDNGVSCPAGFSPSFNGTALKCVKKVQAQLDNSTRSDCPQDAPSFAVFQRMSGNKDICRNASVDIPSDSNLANFENGQIVITIPPGRVVPGSLLGHQITTTPSGAKRVILRPNADFIFFESSKTAARAAALATAKEESHDKTVLAASNNTAQAHLTSIASVVDGLGGSLDKVNVNIDVTAFAQP